MPASSSKTVTRCRVCGFDRLRRYLDLGRTPLANAYLEKKDLAEPEFTEELCLQFCERCGLSQLTKVVPPDLMFKHYLYISSTTATIRDHFGELAAAGAKAAGARPGDLALDIASNDGTLLKAFKNAGLKAVGVDPAENLAAEANAAGLTTECAYWDRKTAERIVGRHGRPKLVTACNVFAHADDLHSFMDGVGFCLAAGGRFIIEAPYIVDFIERCEFDTAYHEHLSYLGLTPMEALMKAHGFAVVDVERFPDIHGGTARYYCARSGEARPSRRVERLLSLEEEFGIGDARVYDGFAKRVLDNRSALRELVARLRGEGRTLWAYGASAKGNTLMNFFGLTSADVPIAVDDNPKKWDLYTPGAHMRVAGVEQLKSGRPDFLLLLAWNFEAEIRARCRAAGYAGGFIVPVPQARVVTGDKGGTS